MAEKKITVPASLVFVRLDISLAKGKGVDRVTNSNSGSSVAVFRIASYINVGKIAAEADEVRLT